MIKLAIILFLTFILPAVLKSIENKQKKEARKESPPRRGPRPKEGQTLAEWIEDVRKTQSQPSTPPMPQAEKPVVADISIPVAAPAVEVVEEKSLPQPLVARVSKVEEQRQRDEALELSRKAAEMATTTAQKTSRSLDSAKRAASARPATRERGRRISERSRRESAKSLNTLIDSHSDLRRALLLREIFAPPHGATPRSRICLR